MCEGFPGKFRQSIMGRVRSGTCRWGGRRGGEELMCGQGKEEIEGAFGSPKALRKSAVDPARTCHFQGANLFE